MRALRFPEGLNVYPQNLFFTYAHLLCSSGQILVSAQTHRAIIEDSFPEIVNFVYYAKIY